MTTAHFWGRTAPHIESVLAPESHRHGRLTSVAAKNREAWSAIIDNTLVEWGKNPAALADEDGTPPSRDILAVACKIARKMATAGEAPPTRVMATVEGGVLFVLSSGETEDNIEVLPDGTLEFSSYRGHVLESRHTLPA